MWRQLTPGAGDSRRGNAVARAGDGGDGGGGDGGGVDGETGECRTV